MKQKLLFAAAATALMAVPSLAAAQDDGWYLRGQAGYGVLGDTALKAGDESASGAAFVGLQGDIGGEGDLAYGLGAGYDFGDGWRLELAGDRVTTDFGTIGGQSSTLAKMNLNTLMLNALYDFNDFGRWSPYVGAGVGIGQVDPTFAAHDLVSLDGGQLARNPACAQLGGPAVGDRIARDCDISDSKEDAGFVWNALLGLSYAISDNLDWDTNFRYTDAGEVNLTGTTRYIDGDQNVVGTGIAETTVDDVSAYALMTGFRYRFGDSTPPPVVVAPVVPVAPTTFICADGTTEVTDLALCPVVVETFRCWDGSEVTDLSFCPAEPVMVECPDGTFVSDIEFCPRLGTDSIASICSEPARQEIIYYEFDRGQSAETRNTINRILDIGSFCQVDNIRVVGHTDTSGSAAYNLNLSKRRAADAREELVRQGINPAMITSEGKGETEPFVQTGDGVKEQLNRRTEVLITLSDVGAAAMMMNN